MSIQERLSAIENAILTAEQECKRPPNSVCLMGVSKKQPAEMILEAHKAGLNHFGENYLQEALPKIEILKNHAIHWHFIGPIQSNKAKTIARHFSWVHSLDRIKIAQLLNEGRQEQQNPLNICVQVNLDHEITKSGIPPEKLFDIIEAILPLPNLNLKGLMTMPKPIDDPKQQKDSFLRLKHLLISVNNRYNLNLKTLSMGSSQDYQAAIYAGSTIVRVGQAIFGKRK